MPVSHGVIELKVEDWFQVWELGLAGGNETQFFAGETAKPFETGRILTDPAQRERYDEERDSMAALGGPCEDCVLKRLIVFPLVFLAACGLAACGNDKQSKSE